MNEQDPGATVERPHQKRLREMRLRLTYFPPLGHGETMNTEISVSDEVFSEVFAQLPRDREIYFAIEDQRRALEMQKARKDLANRLAAQLAHELLRFVESKDPHYGFSQEQWADITREQ